MKVILIGQMGAGKSTTAALLAERMGIAAIDLDRAIEDATGESVAALFARGEPEFRVVEARVLAAVLAQDSDCVLATGGGAPCQPGALAKMRAAGVVVWLAAAPAVLAARALGGGRPLLAGMDVASAERFLETQLEVRRPFYAAADLIVDAAPAADEVASAIDRALSALVDSRR